MKIFERPVVRWAIFGVIVIIAGIRAFTVNSDRPTNGYDEQMWTSASITSYHMFVKGHVRPTEALDNWFASYAYKNQLNVFASDVKYPLTGAASGKERIPYDGKPSQDSLLFPYELIADASSPSGYSIIAYDTVKFPRKSYQWFDRAIWTFGWKAPNFGKYLMGWYIQQFSSNKPDPNGYFEFFLPAAQADTSVKEHKPSTQKTAGPFSYAPDEYIRIARQPNAVFTIFIVAIVFLMGWNILGFWTGFAGALWLTVNSTFMEVNSVVGLDSFSTFFTTSSVFILALIIEGFRKGWVWWKLLLFAALSAVNIGLAMSSKLNAGVLVYINIIIYGLAGLILLLDVLRKKQERKTNAIRLVVVSGAGLISGIFGILLFIGLNPQVQHEPAKKISTMRQSIDAYFTDRSSKLINEQVNKRIKGIFEAGTRLVEQGKMTQNDLNGYVQSLNTIGSQYQAMTSLADDDKAKKEYYYNGVYKSWSSLLKLEESLKKIDPTLSFGNTEFFNGRKTKDHFSEKFNLVLKSMAVVLPKPVTGTENYYGSVGALLPFTGNPVDGLFVVLGLIALLGISYKGLRSGRTVTGGLVILVSALVIFQGNINFIWQDWPRYFTPMFPLYSLLFGAGIVFTVEMIRKRILARKAKKLKATQPAASAKTKKS